MPNIGTVLKAEIARVARKELRSETEALKKTSAQYRSQIAELKRRVQSLEQQLRKQGRAVAKVAPQVEEEGDGRTGHRFSAKGFAAHRQRLGISAAAMAKLLGVSSLSVYKWESGKTRPRAKQVEAIARVRGMGKREVARLLGEQGGEEAGE